MKLHLKNKALARQLAIALCALACTAGAAQAQTAKLPAQLLVKELSPEVSRSIKKALDENAEPCGLEGAHEKHAHENKMRQVMLSRDAVTTADSARKLIFTPKELSLHKIKTLVEALGELNAEDTDKLLRSVYDYADTLAASIAVDIEDAELKQRVINSNRQDIKIAVVEALGKNKSKNLNDLLQKSASGQDYLATQSKAVLKAQNRN